MSKGCGREKSNIICLIYFRSGQLEGLVVLDMLHLLQWMMLR